ncbi:hypothetical protein ACFO8Q_21110 [Effusibacillus consociatus]|uniref:Uncharacterized protein n=1 Tax=Effusibacillus consociatus TaxID=1117041 RepID=A0ABV9Q5R0_9BACL
MKQRRKMRPRDKMILWVSLLFGLSGAGYMLYLQYLYSTGSI